MSIEVTGVDATIRAIGKASEDTGQTIAESLIEIAEMIGERADYYCPYETGAMQASKHIAVTGRGFGCRAEVIYGGPTAPYTVYVHEDLTKFHYPPTCAKWLERAVREGMGDANDIIRRKLVTGMSKIIGGDVLPIDAED
jgi:hypothetical protein